MPQMGPIMWVGFPMIMVIVVLVGVVVLHGVSLVGVGECEDTGEESMKSW